MDINALRIWGIAVSAALIAACLVLAYHAPAPEAFAQEAAQAPSAAPVRFLVRFQGGGPIARAQALAERGRTAPAQVSIEAQLVRQSAFAGLCFDRFTAGAAEVVLRSCAPIAGAEQAAYADTWLARLRGMRAVAYADVNAVAAQ